MKLSVLLAAGFLAVSVCGAASADEVNSLLEKSHAAEAKGETQTALMMLQSAIVADPARASTYVALGDFYLRNHADAQAHKYFDEALNIDPKNMAAHKGLAGLDHGEKTATAQTDLLDKK